MYQYSDDFESTEKDNNSSNHYKKTKKGSMMSEVISFLKALANMFDIINDNMDTKE